MSEADPDFFTDPRVIQAPRGYFHHTRARCPVMRRRYQTAQMCPVQRLLLGVRPPRWS